MKTPINHPKGAGPALCEKPAATGPRIYFQKSCVVRLTGFGVLRSLLV